MIHHVITMTTTHILSQYTFFDAGLQCYSFHRLPKDLCCNQCPFCPEFKPTLQKFGIDSIIERQLSHQQEGKCKKRRSLYDCRSSTFNSTSFFSHFQGKKDKCPLHLLLWIYLNEMYPRKPSSEKNDMIMSIGRMVFVKMGYPDIA